jgi:IS30 family transposase
MQRHCSSQPTTDLPKASRLVTSKRQRRCWTICLILAATTPDELTALARRMNATPRKCLQFKTPAEVLQAFVTASATPTIVEGTVSRFG